MDVVIITSPPDYHFEMAKSSLEAGKHVVVEKPFVPTAKEAAELAEISKKTGKKLAVYQNRRWDADFLTLKKILAEGTLGDIAEFETHFDRHRPDPPPGASWKNVDAEGHGALYDLGTHLLDQVYHLFGKPRKVTGFVGRQRRGVTDGAPDSFTAILHYDGPTIVTAKAGVVSPEEEQLRYWVKGTKGSFKKASPEGSPRAYQVSSDILHSSISMSKKTSSGSMASVQATKTSALTLQLTTELSARFRKRRPRRKFLDSRP